MKIDRLFLFAAAGLVASLLFSCNGRPGKPRVLVFSKTMGFRHSSIPNGKAAIMKLGAENGFLVDTTEDAAYISEDSLKHYSAVIFLHSTGNILDNYQEADFERYIQAGGGYVGIHAASDAEYDWGWYGRLVGAYFASHPKQQEATLNVVDSNDASTKHLPAQWRRFDEWYNFKKLSPDVHVLLKIDEKSYEGGQNGDNHPMAWYHEYDGGRAWYTELGHTEQSFTEENYLKHLLGGIKYAIGGNKELDYAKAKTMRVPDEDRFTKVQLTQGTLFEPTELTVLPNLDVLIAQRRGELMLYRNSDHSVKQAGLLNVYWKTHTPGVNAEEGLMGLKADPDFKNNHFVYLFYSPADTSVNRLSRFKFENDSLDLKSEKVILQFFSQREICCHTGGSIAFGKDNMLFLSTGDNSTPFDEGKNPYANHGFAPLDDRPGHQQFDARRSAGNTNDLRGKILRIKMNPDGTYSIPPGNLFAANTANVRPEIYVMGNRNPYRISVDQENGYLYWGEVGPDAPSDSLDTRGPRGYDELNQARKAGYFGWPLFVGNNYPYHVHNYATGENGPPFDAAKPVNESRNNTGLRDLPAVSPGFIWYPYAESPEFPQLGTGGRNAMAGPVYYTSMFPEATRLPDYYNGKLFMYEWIRNYIKAVTMLPNGDFDKMEPFMSSIKLSSLIDMEVGPDGRLYLLEYGSGWFSKNPDAGLSRIDYNAGNRPPHVANLTVNKTTGRLPLQLIATIEARDPERDSLHYVWDLGNGIKTETTTPRLEYTLQKPGDYPVSVEVSDNNKATARSEVINVYAGNEAPEVMITVTGNQTFYFPGHPVHYMVGMTDPDDTAAGTNVNNLFVSAEYVEGSDRAASTQGHQMLTAAMTGKSLMASLDCKTCHKVDSASIGPAYTKVAEKYRKDANAVNYLTEKIIHGGGGVWGEVAMPAHPNLRPEDARQIVAWVQSLGDGETKKSLPASGALPPTLDKPAKDRGVLYISATYTDKGGNNIKPLSASYTYALRNSNMYFFGVKQMNGYTATDYNGVRYMMAPQAQGWFGIDSIDVTGINGAILHCAWQNAPESGYNFELHLDTPDGILLGSGKLPGSIKTSKNQIGTAQVIMKFSPVTDGKKHNVIIVSKAIDPKEPNQVALQSIQFTAK